MSEKADQDRFRTMVREGIKEVCNGIQAKLAVETGILGDEQYVGKFLSGQRNVGRPVARRWAMALRIPRKEMPASLAWSITPEEEANEAEEEARAALVPYLKRLSGLQRLPYYAVLELLLGKIGPPPLLTDVYVRPEYRSANDAPRTKRGLLTCLQQGLESALSENPHAVLQGAPGSGKSSAAFDLTMKLADALLDGTDENGWVPVPINARDFLERPRNESFQEALSANILLRFGEKVPAELFAKPPPFRHGKWLLIFDGLDEIVEQSTRAELIKRINERAKQYHCPYKFLVTSRPMEEVGRFTPNFARLKLLSFGPDQVDDLVHKWFKAIAGERATEMSKGFRDWLTMGRIGDIATSPAMLTIAAIVYQYSDRALPNNRIEVYAAYAEIMLGRKLKGRKVDETWSVGSAMRSALADGEQYGEAGRNLATGLVAIQRSLFEGCAHRLQNQTEIDFVAEAIEKVRQAPWFGSIPYDIQADSDLMKPWIEELLRRSGVVQENLNGFSFVHNTMREYLAAAHLERSLTNEGARWAFVRRWSEARWREIVFFFLALISRTPEGNAEASAYLRVILSSGPRGVHFAGTALAEGVVVDEDTAAAIIDGLIVRANSWNLCNEYLSDFKSPDVTEVLRMLAHHPRIRTALFLYLRRGGNGCPKSLQAMFNFSEEIANPEELEDLAKNGSALWVRVGAMTGLLRRGELERARPLVEAAMSRLGTQYGIDVVLALSSCSANATLLWVTECWQASRIVRLTALLFLGDNEMPEAERYRRIEGLSQEIEDWEPITRDVLTRLAKEDSLSLLLSSKLIERSRRLTFCGMLIDAGYGEAVIDHLEEALLNGSLKDRATAAKLLFRQDPAADLLLKKVQALCRIATTDYREFVDLAELCESLGDSQFLETAMNKESWPVSERCRAAVLYSRVNPAFRDVAFDVVRRLSQKMDPDLEGGDLVNAAFAIDTSDAAISEVLSWVAGKTRYGAKGLEQLYERKMSWALVQTVGNSNMTLNQRLYAIRALKELGEGESLHALALRPYLEFDLRLACAEQLSDLGWTPEVRTWVENMLEGAEAEQKFSILERHHVLKVSEISLPTLEAIRDDRRASPAARLRAAKILGQSPWLQNPTHEFVHWLLAEGQTVELRADAISWIRNPSDFGFESTLLPKIESRIVGAIFNLLCDVKAEVTIKRQMLGILQYCFSDVRPPADVVCVIVEIADQIDPSLLKFLERHREDVDGVAMMLERWSESEMDSWQRLLLADVALGAGCIDVASRELERLEHKELGLNGIQPYADLLRRSGSQEEAEGVLQLCIDNDAAEDALRFASVCYLYRWGAISREVAYNLTTLVYEGAAIGDTQKAMAHLSLAEIGALPDDACYLRDALVSDTLPFDAALRICRILIQIGERTEAKTFLERCVREEHLERAVPACAFLLRHMPEAVTLPTIKRALSSFGEFKMVDLVEICAATDQSADGSAIQNEVLTFVGYCDVSSQAMRDFAKGLFRSGLTDLSRQFAHWLTDVGRNELVDDWGMKPTEAEEFFALLEVHPR